MKTDIVIVGGGIIGLYTAYSLLDRGLAITVIDQGKFGQQSTWASGGILTPLLPWDYSQKVTTLTNGADFIYQEEAIKLLDKTGIDIEFWRCGMQVLDQSDVTQAKLWCLQNKIPFEAAKDSYTLPACAQLRSPRLIKALVKYLKSSGVTLLPDTTFNQFNLNNNRICSISTSMGEIDTPRVVFAAGARKQLNDNIDMEISMPVIEPVRGQMIAFHAPELRLDNILYRDGHYLVPRRDGLILAGSTLEQVGFNTQLTASARMQLKEAAYKILPSLCDYPIVHQWCGLRPGSKDNIPTIGPHPILTGLYINCGHFRYGVAMAPKSAEIIKDWITQPNKTSNDSNYLMQL